MSIVLALWRRLPVVVRAVVTGLVLAAAGTTPWAILVSANMKHWSGVPWAVPLTALYLWLYWRYIRGEGWPRSTSAARRTLCRANRLSADTWGMALLAGFVGLTFLVLLQQVLSRLVSLPQQQVPDVLQYPGGTVLLWVLMSAVVAGVAEEASFRGYMQGPIERRHGPVVAIVVTGSLFGLAHFTHPEVTAVLLPYYLAVAAVYGALAYLTNSILPSVVLHAGGNVLSAFDLFTRGRAEWQASPTPKALIWVTGPDASFWISLSLAVLVGAAAVSVYATLARTAQRTGPGAA